MFELIASERRRIEDHLRQSLAEEAGVSKCVSSKSYAEIGCFLGGDRFPVGRAFDEGGVSSQSASDAQLISGISSVNAVGGGAVLLQDPWAEYGDELVNSEIDSFRYQGGVYYLVEAVALNKNLFRRIRASFVSYKKIGFYLNESVADVRNKLNGDVDVNMICKMVSMVFVNIFDDEGWVFGKI